MKRYIPTWLGYVAFFVGVVFGLWGGASYVELGLKCPECLDCVERPIVEHEVVDCNGKSIRDCFAERDAKQKDLEALAREVTEILEVKRK